MAGNTYQDLYTWRNKLGRYALAHHEGTTSVMLGWKGLDYEMQTQAQCWESTVPIFDLLHSLDHRFFHEFHFWREKDDAAIRRYKSIPFSRGGDFARSMRDDIAEHLRPFVRVNEVALVSTYTPPTSKLLGKFKSAKKHLIQQTRRGAELIDSVQKVLPLLPGARLYSNDEYEQRVLRTCQRDVYLPGRFKADPWIFLNEQWVRKPELQREDHMLYLNGFWHKLLFVPLYPDATPGWFLNYSFLNCNMHAVMMVKPMDTHAATRQSETAEKFSGAHTARTGLEYAAKHLEEETSFRQLIVDNDLMAFRNCFVIHLYDENKDHVQNVANDIQTHIRQTGGKVEMDRRYQLPFFRASQPGQGYTSSFFRKDHTWQVGAMLPTQVYRTGAARGEQLRLGVHGQPIFLSYPEDEVNHSLSSAKTGSGKDVQNQQTVLETFCTGTNLYLLECDDSYQWMFQALGGEAAYLSVDPEQTVVSPFPPYSAADPMAEHPLPSAIMTGTVRALAFLLLDAQNAGDVSFKLPIAYESAAQAAMRILYASQKPGQDAPLFQDFYEVLANPFFLEDKPDQLAAAKEMAANIGAFLDTQEGKLFNQPANISINSDIVGVNLKPVVDNPRLFQFYLVFFSLRLAQMASTSNNSSRFMLNEFHVFVHQAHDVIGGLMDGIARMGRKRGQSLDLITQENEEMDVVSKAVINSLSHLSLLYRQGLWHEIGKRLNVPEPVCDVWASFKKPDTLPYRNCIRSFDNEYYNLLLSYPDSFLLFSSTKKSHRELKARIAEQTADPFERLRLLSEKVRILEEAG